MHQVEWYEKYLCQEILVLFLCLCVHLRLMTHSAKLYATTVKYLQTAMHIKYVRTYVQQKNA